MIDYLTLADCNNPARGQKQGDIRTKDETRNRKKNKQTSNNKNKQITNRNRGGKQTSRLIGNRRRKDDGNGSSVPPRKTHLRKKNKSTHNRPRCLSRSA